MEKSTIEINEINSPEEVSDLIDDIEKEINNFIFELEKMMKEAESIEDCVSEIKELLNEKEEENLKLCLKHLAGYIINIGKFSKSLSSSAESLNITCGQIIKKDKKDTTVEGADLASVICFSCKHINSNVDYCEKCGRRLAKVFTEESFSFDITLDDKEERKITYKGYVMTPNIEKIREAVEKIRQGEVRLDEFEAVLDQMDKNIETGEKQKEEFINFLDGVNELEIEAEEIKKIYGFYEEAVKTLEDGINQIKEGIESLRLYIEDKATFYLDDGLEDVLEGSQLVIKFHEMVSKIPFEEGNKIEEQNYV